MGKLISEHSVLSFSTNNINPHTDIFIVNNIFLDSELKLVREKERDTLLLIYLICISIKYNGKNTLVHLEEY